MTSDSLAPPVDPGAQLHRLATGFAFTEGLASDARESALLVSPTDEARRARQRVVRGAGRHLGLRSLGERLVAIAIPRGRQGGSGGAGRRTLYLTATTSLYAVETRVASTRLPLHE